MKNVLAAVVAIAVVAGINADDKIDAGKIVGKWEVQKSGGDVPKGTVVEFTKDGKLTVTIVFNDKSLDISGTYKVDGKKLSVKIKGPDGKEEEDTDEIVSLSDDKLVIKGKDGKESEMTKVKAKDKK